MPPVFTGAYMLPPRPVPYNLEAIAVELEVEPLDGEWDEINGRHSEPKGLTKEQINKLPSYIVTKKTMEEFTEK